MHISKLLSQISLDPNELDIPQGDLSSSTTQDVLSLLFGFMAGTAMIVIIIAGIYFMLSQGEPQKANNARNTIIYAGVGLGLAAGAFALVKLVAGSL